MKFFLSVCHARAFGEVNAFRDPFNALIRIFLVLNWMKSAKLVYRIHHTTRIIYRIERKNRLNIQSLGNQKNESQQMLGSSYRSNAVQLHAMCAYSAIPHGATLPQSYRIRREMWRKTAQKQSEQRRKRQHTKKKTLDTELPYITCMYVSPCITCSTNAYTTLNWCQWYEVLSTYTITCFVLYQWKLWTLSRTFDAILTFGTLRKSFFCLFIWHMWML